MAVKCPFTGLHDKSQLRLIRHLIHVWLFTEIICTHNHNSEGGLLFAFYRKEDQGLGKLNGLPKVSSSQILACVPIKLTSLPHHPTSLVTNKNIPLSFSPCPVIVIKSTNSETTEQSVFQGCGCKHQKLPEVHIKNAVVEPPLPETLTLHFTRGLIHLHLHEGIVCSQYRWSESQTWTGTG